MPEEIEEVFTSDPIQLPGVVSIEDGRARHVSRLEAALIRLRILASKLTKR
jgi:hypothetical protein